MKDKFLSMFFIFILNDERSYLVYWLDMRCVGFIFVKEIEVLCYFMWGFKDDRIYLLIYLKW